MAKALNPMRVTNGRKGGQQRAKALTSAERSAIAREGGKALWKRLRKALKQTA